MPRSIRVLMTKLVSAIGCPIASTPEADFIIRLGDVDNLGFD